MKEEEQTYLVDGSQDTWDVFVCVADLHVSNVSTSNSVTQSQRLYSLEYASHRYS